MAFKQKGFPMHSGTSPAKKELIGAQHNLPEELKAKIKAAPAKQKLTEKVDRRKELMNEMRTIEALEKKAITNAGQKRLQQISDELTEMDKSEKANVSKKVEATAEPKRTIQASGEKTVK